MALPPLATPEQLAAWMQTDVASLPGDPALVLAVASQVVRKRARQWFTVGTTAPELCPRDGYVDPPQRPVRAIVSVTDADTGASLEWKFRRGRVYVGRYVEAVKLTYTHGYTEVPADVLGIVLGAASRALSNPDNLRQETVGSISLTYSVETLDASLSERDRDLLDAYRRGVAVVSTG
ncbi:head-to-tail connector complex protein [Streptomyces phage Nesbitt]|uniref:Head-to-tail connector complex protein n=1 Tax=Streptomyces phage Nesbitt TaxID=2108133 RepID=A0A2P1JSZ0_9CAUD|nr:head-to-tail connector complex protein [Streptomyces phage Nesbitt]